MDPQIKKRRIEEVIHYPTIQRTDRGGVTYGPPQVLKCYATGKITIIRGLDGEEKTSSVQLYCDGMIQFGSKDKFELWGESFIILTYQLFHGLKTGTGTTVVYL